MKSLALEHQLEQYSGLAELSAELLHFPVANCIKRRRSEMHSNLKECESLRRCCLRSLYFSLSLTLLQVSRDRAKSLCYLSPEDVVGVSVWGRGSRPVPRTQRLAKLIPPPNPVGVDFMNHFRKEMCWPLEVRHANCLGCCLADNESREFPLSGEWLTNVIVSRANPVFRSNRVIIFSKDCSLNIWFNSLSFRIFKNNCNHSYQKRWRRIFLGIRIKSTWSSSSKM